MTHKDLAIQQEAITAASLYGADEDQKKLYKAVSRFAPWVKGKHPMEAEEVMLVVRRVAAMGLDPLNPHEVQIWKDRQGVQIQHAYTLLVEWVKHFKGDFTQPIYERLSDHELAEEGLEEDDVAYKVRFLMKDDIPTLQTLIQAGYEPKEARRMLEVQGVGVASASEWNGEYFAPKGRSKAWKVKKRAMTDAIRRKFGTPTRAEIVELRRLRGDSKLTLSDWEVVDADIPQEDQLELARAHAEQREWQEEFDDLSEEEKRERLDHYRELLEGDPEAKEGFEQVAAGDGQGDPSPPEPNVIDATFIESGERDPFAPLSDRPELYDAATYETPKGATLGLVKRKELSNMLDYFNALDDPSEEAQEIKGHVEKLLDYLQDFNGNIDVYASLDPWEPEDIDESGQPNIDAQQVVVDLRVSSGWTQNGDSEWERSEADEPDKKAMQRCAAVIGHAVGGDDDKRHDLLAVVYGESSTKALNEREVEAVLERWERKDEAWKANSQGFFEAHAILDAHSLLKDNMFSDTL